MRWILAISLLLSAGVSYGQKYPERRHIRAGNREYAASRWEAGEVSYLRALEKDPASYEARFNLANALYRQERWDEAANIFTQLAADSTVVSTTKAAAHYNAGNALFQQRKLKESLEEYKNSLRAEPSDMDAKFNYAYVKKLLEDGQGGGGGEDEQEQDQDQEQEDRQSGGDRQQQSDGEQERRQGDGGRQEAQAGMSREDAERMLEAMQAQEERTQDKVDAEKKAAVTGRSRKNW